MWRLEDMQKATWNGRMLVRREASVRRLDFFFEGSPKWKIFV